MTGTRRIPHNVVRAPVIQMMILAREILRSAKVTFITIRREIMAMLIPPRVRKGSHLSFHGQAEVGVLGSQEEMFARGQGKGALMWSF